MNDDYLWDQSGTTDPDVAYFEQWAGQFGHDGIAARVSAPAMPDQRPPRSRLGFGPGLAIGAAAAVLLMWLGLRDDPTALPSAHSERHDHASAITATSPPVAEFELPIVHPPTQPAIASPPLLPEEREADTPPTSPPPRAKRPRPGRRPKQTPAAEASSEEPAEYDFTALRDQVVAHAEEIKKCYRDHSSAPKGALVMLMIGIDRKGSVVNPKLERHNIRNDAQGRAVAKCLATMMKSWRLPPADPPVQAPVVLFGPGPPIGGHALHGHYSIIALMATIS